MGSALGKHFPLPKVAPDAVVQTGFFADAEMLLKEILSRKQ
jgi:hypothetical protein